MPCMSSVAIRLNWDREFQPTQLGPREVSKQRASLLRVESVTVRVTGETWCKEGGWIWELG